MNATSRSILHINRLEEQSLHDTLLHRRHPAAHLFVTLGFIAVAASYGRYAVAEMLPMLFYPVFICAAGEIPPRLLFWRLLLALPFVLGVGIFNPILDKQSFFIIPGVAVSMGWLSLASILLRCALSVSAVLLLIAVEGMAGFCGALRFLRVPRAVVVQLMLTFRYLSVLAEEVSRILLAYRLRSGRKGVAYGQWGPLAGQWLMRSLAKAERVYNAMQCRGFTGDLPQGKLPPFTPIDALYVLLWGACFFFARAVNLPAALGRLVVGGAL